MVPRVLMTQLPRGWGCGGLASSLPASQALILQGLRERNFTNRVKWDEFHIIPTLIESEYLLIKLTVVVGKGDGALSLQPAEPPTARSGGHTVNPRSIIAYFPTCFPSRKKITTGMWATSKSLCQFHQSLGGHTCIVHQWLQRDDHSPHSVSKGHFFFTDWHHSFLFHCLKPSKVRAASLVGARPLSIFKHLFYPCVMAIFRYETKTGKEGFTIMP